MNLNPTPTKVYIHIHNIARGQTMKYHEFWSTSIIIILKTLLIELCKTPLSAIKLDQPGTKLVYSTESHKLYKGLM